MGRVLPFALTWKRLLKTAYDHPYFDFSREMPSEEEASRLLGDDFPTFEELVESIRQKYDFPPEAYEAFDKVIAKRAAARGKGKTMSNSKKRE